MVMGKRRKRRGHSLRFSFGLLLWVSFAVILIGMIYITFSMTMFMVSQATGERTKGGMTLTVFEAVPDSWTTDISGVTGETGGTSYDEVLSELGVVGLRGLFIASAQKNVYKEYLEIVRDHCNYTYMNPATKKVIRDDGSQVFPNISSILGLTLCEDNSKGLFPAVLVNDSKIDTSIKYSLKQFNSEVIKGEPASLNSRYNLNLQVGSGSYRTPFQFGEDFACIYPAYTNASCGFYPSLMNGWGVSSGVVRDKTMTDAAYLPDQTSIVVQYVFNNITTYFDVKKLSDKELGYLIYPSWNGGFGVFQTWGWNEGVYSWTADNNKFSAGGSWLTKSNLTMSEVRTSSVQLVSPLLDKLDMTYAQDVANNNNSLDGLPKTYVGDVARGMATTALLLNGGFMATQSSKDRLITQMERSSSFLDGAVYAWQVFKNKNVTRETVKNYLESLSVISIDESFYGPAVTGKPDTTEFVIHVYDNRYKVYNNEGAGTRSLLRAYPVESYGGMFLASLTGSISYWKMLTASGVECTLADAVKDLNGNSEKSLAMYNTKKGSYYLGTRKFACVFGDGKDSLVQTHNSSTLTFRTLNCSGGVHYGDDFGSPSGRGTVGDPLHAIADGVVDSINTNLYTSSGKLNSRGYWVLVTVSDSYENAPKIQYRFQHMDDVYVKPGDVVREGDVLGTLGGTGIGTGTHVHIEVLCDQGPTGPNGKNTLAYQYRSLFNGWYTLATGYGVIYNGGAKTYRENGNDLFYPGYVYDTNKNNVGNLKALPWTDGTTNIKERGPNYFADLSWVESS